MWVRVGPNVELLVRKWEIRMEAVANGSWVPSQKNWLQATTRRNHFDNVALIYDWEIQLKLSRFSSFRSLEEEPLSPAFSHYSQWGFSCHRIEDQWTEILKESRELNPESQSKNRLLRASSFPPTFFITKRKRIVIILEMGKMIFFSISKWKRKETKGFNYRQRLRFPFLQKIVDSNQTQNWERKNKEIGKTLKGHD